MNEDLAGELAQLRADRRRDQQRIQELQRRFRKLADDVAYQGLLHRGLPGDKAKRSAYAEIALMIRRQAYLGDFGAHDA